MHHLGQWSHSDSRGLVRRPCWDGPARATAEAQLQSCSLSQAEGKPPFRRIWIVFVFMYLEGNQSIIAAESLPLQPFDQQIALA
jgi:hypothetical protein